MASKTISAVTSTPRIDACPIGIVRPRWSVMIPTYNSTEYLLETLHGVLSQDPGSDAMQIEVVDDCSTKDDPAAVAKATAGERVHFNRQLHNVGAIENFNTCVRRARGEWVHLLHSDDGVYPGFYARMAENAVRYPEAGAIICRIAVLDHSEGRSYLSDLEASERGYLGPDFVIRLLRYQRLQFAGIVVRRSVYQELGGFRPELPHCADWDMWIRIALNRSIVYEPEPLAYYRVHAGSDTSRLIKSGENVADQRRAIQIACSYVTRERAKAVYQTAMKAASVEAIARARRLWNNGFRRTALRQLCEAMRCSVAPGVIARLIYFWARALIPRRRALPAKAISPPAFTSRN
jgi:glycosyltransferase involved in cell wall biosynthesis